MYSSLAGLFLIDFRLIWWTAGRERIFRDLIASVEWLQNTLHGRGWCGENTLVQNADAQYLMYIGVMGTVAVWCWCRSRQVGSRARSCVDAGKTGGHNFQSRFHHYHRHHHHHKHHTITNCNQQHQIDAGKSHTYQISSRLPKFPKSNENSVVLLIFFAACKKNWRPVVRLILMPPTFHIACLKRYSPTLHGYP